MDVYIRPGTENAKEKQDNKGFMQVHGAVKMVVAVFLFLAIITSTILFSIKNITIKVDGKDVKIQTLGGTVNKALQKAGVKLDEKDSVKPSLTANLRNGTVIDVKRAVPIEVVISGKSRIVKTAKLTVKEVLTQEKINIAMNDKVVPKLSTKVSSKMKITIVRVNSANETKEIEIAYSVENRYDDNIEVGFSKVMENGETGIEKQVVKITYEDGKEVSREVVGKEVVKAPKNQVVAIGNLKTVSRGGQSFSFSRVAFMTATGYTHTGNRTATGTAPRRGIIAVDPTVIPLGSRVYIEKYGYAIAADTGGAIQGNIIDLFFETYGEAAKWGRQSVKVYILQ